MFKIYHSLQNLEKAFSKALGCEITWWAVLLSGVIAPVCLTIAFFADVQDKEVACGFFLALTLLAEIPAIVQFYKTSRDE